MNKERKIFIVYDEKGGKHQLPAKDENDAIEVYWKTLESVLGHQEGCCACFKDPKPFPRHKYLQPIKVKMINLKEEIL